MRTPTLLATPLITALLSTPTLAETARSAKYAILASALVVASIASYAAAQSSQIDGDYAVKFGTYWYDGDVSCAYFQDERLTFQTISPPTGANIYVDGSPIDIAPFTLYFREYIDENGQQLVELNFDQRLNGGAIVIHSNRLLVLKENGQVWQGDMAIRAYDSAGNYICAGSYLLTARRR